MNEDPINAIHARLTQLQHGPARRYLVVTPPPIGLGGQIADRIAGLLLAIALDRKAVFSIDDPPYSQTFEQLYSDAHISDSSALEPVRSLHDEPIDVLVYNPLALKISHGDLNDGLIRAVQSRLALSSLSDAEARGAAFLWMRLSSETSAFCQSAQERLGIDSNTLGVHFRRGDKQVETAFVPASEFNAEIARIYNRWRFKKIFLASDSPLALAEIHAPDGVPVIFDDQELRYNNANHKMLMGNSELIDQETKTAFKNIYLLSKCGGVVGQDNAHFASISASALKATGVNEDRVFLIPGNIAEIRSARIRFWFRLNKIIRGIGRSIFPFLTTAARMSRAQNGR